MQTRYLLLLLLCPLVCSHGQTLWVPSGTVGSISGGNVGIGTNSPDAKLHVVGDLYLSPSSGNYLLRAYGPSAGFQITNESSFVDFRPYHPITGDKPLHIGPGAGGVRINVDGRVGIGTNLPTGKLHVASGSDYVGTIRAEGPSGGYSSFGLHEGGNYRASMYWHPTVPGVGFYGAQTWFFESGNVGIGTTHPSNVQGWTRVLDVHGGNSAKILVTEGAADVKTGIFSHASWWAGGVGKVGTESNHPLALMAGYGNDVMTLLPSGNVGIGTKNPSHKLAVNGTGKFKEVIVETTGWSDYVFAPDYELQPLSEVEAHIKKHQHLPGFPSADEVAEEGVSVGEMQAKLLAKIEELTLHVIAQSKELQAVRADNASLRNRLDNLEHQNSE